MQYNRDHAPIGETVHLWLNVRDSSTKETAIPTSVGTVDILREVNGTDQLITTLTPELANPGTYLATWNIPDDAYPGTYFDRWNDVVIDGHPTTKYVDRILVVVPEIESDLPIVSEDYVVSLTTREIIRNSITYLQAVLVKPKNAIFPKTQARIRNSAGQYTDRWVDVVTKNNEGFVRFDSTGITLGQYYIQYKLRVGTSVLISPEYSFTVREV